MFKIEYRHTTHDNSTIDYLIHSQSLSLEEVHMINNRKMQFWSGEIIRMQADTPAMHVSGHFSSHVYSPVQPPILNTVLLMPLHTTLLSYIPSHHIIFHLNKLCRLGLCVPTITTFFRHCCPLAFPVYLSIDNGNLDTRKSPFYTSFGISDYFLGTEWILNGNNIFICHLLNLTPHATLKDS